MNSIQNRINAFVKLGTFLSQFSVVNIKKTDTTEYNEIFFDGFLHQIKLAQEHNSWFTKDNILFSLNTWSKSLTTSNLTNFTNSITLSENPTKKVAIIMAGNIPLVGFHDFLSVLISGHSVLVKLSSFDSSM